MSAGWLPRALAPRLPFFYGWLILFSVCCAGFARQGPAVATLSIFIEPMTTEFGWSRTAISGAVSIGGVMAAVLSPFLGPLLDRHGARVMLVLAVIVTAVATGALSLTGSLVFFYVAFCIARTCFAGPFDLGIYGALNNWFVARRAIATSLSNVAMMAGLVAMPYIAHVFIDEGGWRAGWIAIGLTVLGVGLLPNLLFVVRRPEDLGLLPDGGPRRHRKGGTDIAPPLPEPAFTRGQAMRTPAFWLLSLFTLLVYPVQAGISLHQAPHLIERGLDPSTAALAVSAFSLCAGVSGLIFGILSGWLSVRVSLLLTGLLLGVAALLMAIIGKDAGSLTAALPAAIAEAGWWLRMADFLASPGSAMVFDKEVQTFAAAALFGIGIGGVLTILPIAWADYFGRRSYGAIRGVALSIQVVAQASGPVASGFLRDLTGDYTLPLLCFAGCSFLAMLVALFASRPGSPVDAGEANVNGR